MGGSLTKPNRIKDVYTKLVFYDGNKLKYDNGSSDVIITEADNFSADISVASAVLLDTETIDGGSYQP